MYFKVIQGYSQNANKFHNDQPYYFKQLCGDWRNLAGVLNTEIYILHILTWIWVMSMKFDYINSTFTPKNLNIDFY